MAYLDALLAVADAPGGRATALALAARLGGDSTQASNVLRRAHGRGYLERRRTRNRQNQRVWEYAITQRGRCLLRAKGRAGSCAGG